MHSRRTLFTPAEPARLLTGLPEKIFEAAAAAIVHPDEHRAEPLQRYARLERRGSPALHVRLESAGAEPGAELRCRTRWQRHLRTEERTAEADVYQPDAGTQVEPAPNPSVECHSRAVATLCAVSGAHHQA